MARLVLAGAGHAHAQVLLECSRAPLPGVELVVVSPQALAPYSGMVPGWLAGTYRLDEMVIDFPGLCAAAGARWVAAEVDTLDPDGKQLMLTIGEALGYDLLSLNVGSTLRPPPGEAACMLAMRPLSALPAAYETVLSDWSRGPTGRPWTVTAVGGGAAGVESLLAVLAVLAQLRKLRPDRPVQGGIVTSGTQLLPGLSVPARRAAQLSSRWCEAIGRSSDLVLWATGAEAHDWQRDPTRRGSLSVSAQGFVQVDQQLRSVSHPDVFAVGDCAHWEPGPHALPKAGVIAVRMGPVLSNNLRAALDGAAGSHPYRPQRQFLVLLATGDGRAIASRGPFGTSGSWAWRWKDFIDRRFIARYAKTTSSTASTASTASTSYESDIA